ncbi:hypothetical protein D9619_003389 [Psilocybe cf. subviscida]|uniref:Chalcone isomerase domain-containing protein n=1 Tax=Psilocybe cf. subviscida TaxID=2480587 RepID=A0A8H5AYL8_9AGAR|nr:hypothetical protein D9619_003389 [Psilocybe cf. subviscida]
MSFLAIARAARAVRPAFARRFASGFAPYTPRRSYRTAAWGTAAFGAAAALVATTTQTIYCDVPVVAEVAEETVVDPATSIAFPKVMRIPATIKIPPMELVGLGVRTVSFLGVKVYSVGFYADLNNPNIKITEGMSPEEKIQEIVRNTSCVIRIVPTRNTSYTHLRDAWVRALSARIAVASKEEALSEQTAIKVSASMRLLKSLFPNSPLKKETPLDVFLSAPLPDKQRPLVFRDLGSIEDDWLTAEFVLNYFDSAASPSPALKKSVFERLADFPNKS